MAANLFSMGTTREGSLPLERLAAIVEGSEDAIISKDLSGTIESWNRSAESIFGYTAEEVLGKHISLLTPPNRVDETPQILERIARGEHIQPYETTRRTKDGRVLSISLSVSPIRDADGNVIGASKIARDISEQVRQHQALEQALADLEQFAFAASHDLQEPLRTVAGQCQLLQRRFGPQLGPGADEHIRLIVAGVMRMERLLRDLRVFTQASALEQRPPSNIDSEKTLDGVLENLRDAIQRSGASITHDPLPRIAIHEFQLSQLFQNLIANAIQYHGEAPPRIHVTAGLADRTWTFSVQDNGIGINPRYKEQIFGLFKRLHSAADYPGTGLGLAICQRIVERLGGRIWVESEPGRGSTFYFAVPARANP